jgi:hypothetical protein
MEGLLANELHVLIEGAFNFGDALGNQHVLNKGPKAVRSPLDRKRPADG